MTDFRDTPKWQHEWCTVFQDGDSTVHVAKRSSLVNEQYIRVVFLSWATICHIKLNL